MNDENVMSDCNSLKPKNIEIERKYLIKMPDLGTLRMQPGYSSSSIEQMYIFDSGNSSRDRIRKRVFEDHVEYWKTHKENINGISKIEIENEIMKQISKAVSGCFTMNMLKKAIPVPKLVPIMAMMVKCTANLIPTGHRKVEFSSINF